MSFQIQRTRRGTTIRIQISDVTITIQLPP